jgi:peroxiredoxin Q/BCP
MAIEIGGKAPAFSLEDDAGRKTAASDFAGRWVALFFYPKADTPG